MALYKGIEIADSLVGVIRHMGNAEEYRETLQTLQVVWDNLTLLGQLAGTGTDMSSTRQAFNHLTSDLLDNLGAETLKKTVQAMRSRAQVAIDILVRNLFERTADIGFLATDENVRQYLARIAGLKFSDDPSAAQERAHLDRALRERFTEYVSKYSVYFNVILLDLDGTVLLQLDENNPVVQSLDPLVGDAINTTEAYVETYRHSDLVPGEGESLIYSCRVTAGQGGAVAGVICLCFRFANEAERIFANLAEEDDWSVILLVNPAGRVLASSDPWHIPAGATMETVLDSDSRVVRFAGREYLAVTRPSHGYQGYIGPGWYGHVVVPLEHAFDKDVSVLLGQVEPAALQAVMGSSTLFGEKLRQIPLQAEAIQGELNRTVWNGNVRQSSDKAAANPAFSKILLWEVSNTGLKTREVFEKSIGNLNATVVSAILQDSQLMASLAIDILDRNLYERSNDCRWWALTSLFREKLAVPLPMDGASRQQLEEILSYINDLYTVYTNVLLFDRQGMIVAASRPGELEMAGEGLAEDWVRQCLGLRNSQAYAVSPFVRSPLYGDRHTWVYAAAVHDPHEPGKVAGGIALVFDAEPQLQAMLNDALPRNDHGTVLEGCFGVFLDRKRRVIASSRQEIRPGDVLDIDGDFLSLKHGEGAADIIPWNGHYYAVGSRMSSGYREYNSETDPCHNDVLGLVFVPLGDVRSLTERPRAVGRPRLQINAHGQGEADSVEIATFYVANSWFGIRSEHVVEAVNTGSITLAPGSARYLVGFSLFRGRPIPVIDLGMMMKAGQRPASAASQMIIVRGVLGSDIFFAIAVDALGEIPEVPKNRIESLSAIGLSANCLIYGIAKLDNLGDHTDMLLLVSPEQIAAGAHEMPEMALLERLRDRMPS